MNYQETIQYLYNRLPVFHHIGAKAYKPGLANTKKLMDAFRHPYRNYQTIHVAGTNGKGSVSHFLSAILQAAGYRVGLYTSPHLVDFSERIRLNGKQISRQYVIDFVKNNENLIEDIKPSFFEITMAMAFQYFSDKKTDIAVVETGLGGRLDSTNIIEPILSVITNIGFDHTLFLGNTLPEIAAEKAGIIKPNTPVIIGESHSETELLFMSKAKAENAPIVFAEKMCGSLPSVYKNEKLLIRTPDNINYELGLSGNYQVKNAATVLVAVEQLKSIGLKISEDNIRCGLKNVVQLTGIRGRWEIIKNSPTVILDTAHNAEGIEWVADNLSRLQSDVLHIVFGMANDKDIQKVLTILPKKGRYYFTAADTSRALPSKELKTMASSCGLNGEDYPTVQTAVNSALSNAAEKDVVFIGGSNFVVGEALMVFNNNKLLK